MVRVRISGGRLATVCCLFLLHVGCSSQGDPPLDPANYNRACLVDGDCVLVSRTNCGCSCDSGAIARADLERYQRDLSGRACDRSPPVPFTSSECGACARKEAFCNAGQCDTRLDSSLTPADGGMADGG